jgi:hypothetical protein
MRPALVFAALAVAMVALCAVPAQGQGRRDAAQRAAIDFALERGRLIYAYDQAAWHGTDDLLARSANVASAVGGWIVDGAADAPELLFFDKDRTNPSAVYVARFEGTRLASARLLGPGDDRSISPVRRRMIAARDIAAAAIKASRKSRSCASRPFNTVVLPPASPDAPVPVYFLTPQERHDEYPLGGHFVVEVDATGKAGKVRRFTNSCLAIPASKGDDPASPGFIFVTHLLDPTPTEIHVFTALTAGVPVMVGTTRPQALWFVTGKEIGAAPLNSR